MNGPFVFLFVSLGLFWLSSLAGSQLRKRTLSLEEKSRDDFKFVLGGTLTLLGLIIGFMFSMAVTRYDQRKNYEEEEANAIDTAYLRADFLSAADAAKVRNLLTNYLAQRIGDYRSRSVQELRQIETRTARLQAQMWSAVSAPAAAQPTPITALVVAGMSDVLNSQGYTQAAWRNRVPSEAWALMAGISIFCNLLVGYSAYGRSSYLLLILPIVLSVSLFLIDDIDSPRGGLIRVEPLNLETLAESLR